MAVAARKVPVVLPWRLVRQALHRLTWGVSDQALGALTNFLLSAYIARTLGATDFGAFTLAYVTYGLAINASRGLSIEPLLIRFSGTDLPTWRRAAAGSTGTALLVGMACGVCSLGAGMLIGGTTGRAFVALGVTLPGLMLQDSWRYAFFALGRGNYAFINDAVWAAVQISLLLYLKYSGHADVFWCVLAWGAGATVGAAIGAVQAGVLPSLVGAIRWLSQHRDLGPRYLAENTGNNAADTFRSYAISSILGLAAVGYIQAANVLMGPFKIIFFGLSLITIPEAARILRRAPRHLPTFCAAVSVGLILVAVAWGGFLLVALPKGVGHLVLGQMWQPTYPLVLPTTIALAGSCVMTGGLVGLHALGAARRSLRGVLIGAVVVLACSLVGAKVGGTVGTIRFYAAAMWFTSLLMWWQFRRALHESDNVSVPFWLWPSRPPPRHARSARSKSASR